MANTLIAQGRQAQAIAIIANAAAQGHADALFQQALWHLAGSPLPRNLGHARAALRIAAAGGHAEAQLIEIALIANGSGAPPNWHDAMMLLTRAATKNSAAKAILPLLDAMALTEDGTPRRTPDPENLTPDGAVRRVRRFFSEAECAHVARSVADLLEPAVVADPRTGRSIPHPIRTSDGAVVGPVREDLVIRAINHRIAAISGTHVDQGEALTILRYREGQQFRLHSDALPGVRNQRAKTVIVYLNEGFTGGETIFPEHRLTIRPVAGDAIVFTNLRADCLPDPRARHAGAPVTSGVKWLATRWIRARPFDVWKGPESTT